jgi:hypothetical protein
MRNGKCAAGSERDRCGVQRVNDAHQDCAGIKASEKHKGREQQPETFAQHGLFIEV